MTTFAEPVTQLSPDIQKNVKDLQNSCFEKRAKKKYEVPAIDWEKRTKRSLN